VLRKNSSRDAFEQVVVRKNLRGDRFQL
jgi:hypothetical protein